jgi:putative transcriptional regulator
MPVYNTLPRLINEKGAKENRLITITEVAVATGISTFTLNKWLKNELEQYRRNTIESLCKYFNCQVGDLLYVEFDEPTQKISRRSST